MATEAPLAGSLRRFTVDDLLRMADAGLFIDNGRVELIDGQVVELSPEGPDHSNIITVLTGLLSHAYPRSFAVRVQNTQPIHTHRTAEPDLSVTRRYMPTHLFPTPDDSVLMIEVANTTLRYDVRDKPRVYAAWGVPVYWVVDVRGRRIIEHTDPRPDGYATVRVHDAESPVPLPECDASVAFRDLIVT